MKASYRVGEMVFAQSVIANDGGIPDMDEAGVLADAGARGVVVMNGHSEIDPGEEIFLVRFEDAQGTLGPPVGCLAEELGSEPPSANT